MDNPPAIQRRIDACLFACAGIPTAALEDGAVFQLIAAMQGAMNILGSAESNASGNPEFDYVGPRVAACRAALAKVQP